MNDAACFHEPYPPSGEGVPTDGYTLVGYLCRNCEKWIKPVELVARLRELAAEWLDAGVTEDGTYPDSVVATEDMCARVLLSTLDGHTNGHTYDDGWPEWEAM